MTIERKTQSTVYPRVQYYDTVKTSNDTTIVKEGRTFVTTSPQTFVTYSDYRDKVSSPRINGWREPNAYVRSGVRRNFNLGLWTRVTQDAYQRRTHYSSVEMSTVGPPTMDGFSPQGYGIQNANLQAQANNEALEQLRNSKADLGLFMAEAKLSAEMLVKRGDVLFRAMRAMQDPKYGGFNGALRVLGLKKARFAHHVKNWDQFVLEYQYGWKPFLSDLHGIYDQFGDDLRKAVPLVKGRSSVSERVSSRSTITTPWLGDQTCSGERRCTVAIYGTVELPSLRAASQMGLVNPLSILWERVPYSFLVDWAFPIGQVISNMTAIAGLKYKAGTITHSSRLKSRVERLPSGPLGWQVLTPAVIQSEWYSMNRLGAPSFTLPLPYVKNPFSTQRAINASALFSQTRLR